jgi:hypothetical protein
VRWPVGKVTRETGSLPHQEHTAGPPTPGCRMWRPPSRPAHPQRPHVARQIRPRPLGQSAPERAEDGRLGLTAPRHPPQPGSLPPPWRGRRFFGYRLPTPPRPQERRGAQLPPPPASPSPTAPCQSAGRPSLPRRSRSSFPTPECSLTSAPDGSMAAIDTSRRLQEEKGMIRASVSGRPYRASGAMGGLVLPPQISRWYRG